MAFSRTNLDVLFDEKCNLYDYLFYQYISDIVVRQKSPNLHGQQIKLHFPSIDRQRKYYYRKSYHTKSSHNQLQDNSSEILDH